MNGAMDQPGMRLSRREALEQAARWMAVMGAVSVVMPAVALGTEVASPGDEALGGMVLALLGHVIPETDTPGAGNPDNVQFVMRAVSDGLLGVRSDTLMRLHHDLRQVASGPFEQLPHMAQAVALAKIDAETFGPAQPAITPWLSTKALILIAYFTSEAGASQQLRYEIVPGRFDPDLPLDKDWKPLSNDWAANAIKKGIA